MSMISLQQYLICSFKHEKGLKTVKMCVTSFVDNILIIFYIFYSQYASAILLWTIKRIGVVNSWSNFHNSLL